MGYNNSTGGGQFKVNSQVQQQMGQRYSPMSNYVKNQRLESNPSGQAKRKNNFVRPSSAQQKKKDGSSNPEAENLRNLII